MPTATGQQQSPLQNPNVREPIVKGPTKVEASKTIYEEPTKITHIEQIKKTKEIVEPGKTYVEKVPTEVYEGRSPITIERQASLTKGKVEVFQEGVPHETTRVEREKILHVEPVRRVEVENIHKEQWEEERGRLVEEPASRMVQSPAKITSTELGDVERGLQKTHISGQQPTTLLSQQPTQGFQPQETTTTSSSSSSSTWKGEGQTWKGGEQQQQQPGWGGESTSGMSNVPTSSAFVPPTTTTTTSHGYPPTGYAEYPRTTFGETRQAEGTWTQTTGGGPSSTMGTSEYGTTATDKPHGGWRDPSVWKQEVHSSRSEEPHLHPPGTVPKQTFKQKLKGIAHRRKVEK